MAAKKKPASKTISDPRVDPLPSPDEIDAAAAAAWEGGRAWRMAKGQITRHDAEPWEFAKKDERARHMQMIDAVAAGHSYEGDSPEEIIARALFRA